jgi:Cu2+-exporting ATPase
MGEHGAEQMLGDFRRRLTASLLATLPILLLSPGIPLLPERGLVVFPGSMLVVLVLAAFVWGYGGWPFLSGFVSELRTARFGMMTLVAVGISAAFLYSLATVLGAPGMGFFWELATLVDVMLLGHWVEMRATMRAGRSLQALAELIPKQAHRLGASGVPADIASSEIAVGDRVVVRPGERVPADGRVVAGESGVDESLLTGESMLVAKRPGDEILGGSLNGDGALTVEATRVGEESFLAEVAEIVRRAQESRSRTEALADRAARWLTLVALGGGALTLAGWLLGGAGIAFAVERAVTVVVIACPHALGLAIPLVVARATGVGAASGLLVRDREALERTREVNTVVFDKTGTLTYGRFSVVEVKPLMEITPEELLSLAASVERDSEHPIGRAIAAAASPGTIRPAEQFTSLPGSGAEATVDGKRVHLQAARFAIDLGSDDARPKALEPLFARGQTVAAVSVNGRLAGGIALADTVRPESAAAVRDLQALGVRCVLLTGDTSAAAEKVANEVGTSVFAEVRPADKADAVRSIQHEGAVVAMVGDGVNDAPALASADVGIAIGAGADVAVESAGLVLVRDDPRAVVSAILLARRTYAKMRQNLFWAVGYNVIAIPLAAGMLAPLGIVVGPAVGAAFMSVSTVIVALNASRLR